MSATLPDRSTGTIVVAVPGEELRRQLIDFLVAQGYACLAASTVEAAFEIAGDFCAGPGIVIGELALREGQGMAAALAAAPSALRILLLCSEPEFVAREVVPHPFVTFIEKPFAWSDLKRTLSDMPGARWSRTATPCQTAHESAFMSC